jgi:trimeric autotransporter adhesin
MRLGAALGLAAVVCVSLAGEAFGQGFQGGLRGAIKDSGGVIPGVEVTLTNEQTNIKRSVVTNERGEYSFANVDPGTYSVKAAIQGYKSIDRGGIRVGTQTFLVLDLTLEVGAIEESVTVTGQSPLIETANASQGTVLNTEALQTLPAPGRAAFLVGVSIPTVIPSGDAQFNRQQDQTNASLLSLGGGSRRGNNYTLDGVPITDLTNRAVANPSIEALDDVKVQVHTYDAEMGRTGGGVFNTTLRSGTNNYHGTAFFQTRPVWGAANNYFAQKALENCAAGDASCAQKNSKADQVYYLPGGGFGGPIVKDKTFFWFATENYHDVSTRNGSLLLPTAAERNGDFSAATNTSGQRITIYDPLTHLPFPNNVIPASRISPIALKMLSYVPMPQTDRDNGAPNYNATAQIVDYFQQEYTGKIEHKFTDKISLTGFYLYNRTNEPCSNYFEPGLDGPNRFADPNDYLLKRRPQIFAVNNTWIPSDTSVLALRFGWTRFVDNSTMTIGFDPATLGFSQSFLGLVNQTGVPKFPVVAFTGGYSSLGAINPSQRTYKSYGGNAAYSKFIGSHTYKFGADYRRIGVYLLNPACASGCFNFGREFTSANGLNNGSGTDGNAIATFLLGYPSGDLQAASPALTSSTMTLTTPLDIYTNYYGGYVQDDWRLNSKFTLNYGLRIEREDGMREVNNNFTVGFDRAATSALSSVAIPGSVDPSGGTASRPVVGGLMYAGVNGNNTYQGNPPGVKWSPRVGAVYSLDSRTVLRGGYGLYWAPWNYPVPSATSNNGNYGQIGFTNNTSVPQPTVTPTVSLANPFPNSLVPPAGNSLGLISGAGTSIAFVDQTRTAPRVQQYSADLQRELGLDMAVTVSYIGARGDHLPLGGTVDTPININQLDPKYLPLGSTVLNQQVPNPFFGVTAAGPFANQSTLARGQLLRPFPQFGTINMLQVSEGVNRYNAMVIELNKRVTRGWGGRFSYTYSVLKDNQIGETNFFSNRGVGAAMNNYNYDASAPPCTAGMTRLEEYNSRCFDPLVDYSYGILDVPHRFIVAPIVNLPFGKDHAIGKSTVGNLLAGGWTVSAVFNFQSGFPIGVSQSASNSNLLGNGQRPNVVPGIPMSTPGDFSDRLGSADHPTATWLNPAAFAAAPANTWGDAPRVETDVRTPRIINTDLSVAKNIGLGGRKVAQVKLEIVNLFNRVQLNGLSSTTQGNSAFGLINTQGGFMRMTQVMFRFSW